MPRKTQKNSNTRRRKMRTHIFTHTHEYSHTHTHQIQTLCTRLDDVKLKPVGNESFLVIHTKHKYALHIFAHTQKNTTDPETSHTARRRRADPFDNESCLVIHTRSKYTLHTFTLTHIHMADSETAHTARRRRAKPHCQSANEPRKAACDGGLQRGPREHAHANQLIYWHCHSILYYNT